MLYYVVLSSAMHYSYVCCTIISTSAWSVICDCTLGCIVSLFDCSLSLLKRITVTSAVRERLFSQVVECSVELSRLISGVLHPPIVQIYPPISVSETAAPPPHILYKNDGMQSQSVFNNYYQTVLHMQVHCNQLPNREARGG